MNCITNARTMWMNAAVTISLETDERSESQALLYGLVHERTVRTPPFETLCLVLSMKPTAEPPRTTCQPHPEAPTPPSLDN